MSVQFRQRTPGEYARIVWKRKWLIALPAITIAAAIAWVTLKLPNIYESTALIVVTPSTIPSSVVPTSSEDTLTRQLMSITKVVTSRSSLQPLVEKYDLYANERARGEAMESIIDHMGSKDIRVEMNNSRDITNAFNITFRGPDPRVTQAVTNELTGKYIDAQAKAGADNSRATKDFFENKLAEIKTELDDIARRRLEFMRGNLPNLPDGSESLGIQLTGLYEQQKALIAETGRLRDQQNVLSQTLGDIQKQRQQEIDNFMDLPENDPKRTPEYIELSRRESDLEAEVRNMLVTLREANPDVKKKRDELKDVRIKMERAFNEAKDRIDARRKRLEEQTEPRLNPVRNNIELGKSEIARQQKMLDETNSQIASIQARINAIPAVRVGLEQLDREYKTKQESYDATLEQQRKATTISDITSSQQGESIRVVDSANLPSQPVAPKRPMLIIMGVMLGLFVGLFAALAVELPRLLTIQTTSDAEHYTGLPVLVAVPELWTPREERAISRRRTALLAGGIAVAAVSIPALAFVLQKAHILDRFVS